VLLTVGLLAEMLLESEVEERACVEEEAGRVMVVVAVDVLLLSPAPESTVVRVPVVNDEAGLEGCMVSVVVPITTVALVPAPFEVEIKVSVDKIDETMLELDTKVVSDVEMATALVQVVILVRVVVIVEGEKPLIVVKLGDTPSGVEVDVPVDEVGRAVTGLESSEVQVVVQVVVIVEGEEPVIKVKVGPTPPEVEIGVSVGKDGRIVLEVEASVVVTVTTLLGGVNVVVM